MRLRRWGLKLTNGQSRIVLRSSPVHGEIDGTQAPQAGRTHERDIVARLHQVRLKLKGSSRYSATVGDLNRGSWPNLIKPPKFDWCFKIVNKFIKIWNFKWRLLGYHESQIKYKIKSFFLLKYINRSQWLHRFVWKQNFCQSQNKFWKFDKICFWPK